MGCANVELSIVGAVDQFSLGMKDGDTEEPTKGIYHNDSMKEMMVTVEHNFMVLFDYFRLNGMLHDKLKAIQDIFAFELRSIKPTEF